MKAFRAHQQALPPPNTTQAYPQANTYAYGQNYQQPQQTGGGGGGGSAASYYAPPSGPPPPQAAYRSEGGEAGKYAHNDHQQGQVPPSYGDVSSGNVAANGKFPACWLSNPGLLGR